MPVSLSVSTNHDPVSEMFRQDDLSQFFLGNMNREHNILEITKSPNVLDNF
jgi:hypothetical protein